jgi:hypothetical protein
LYFFNNVVVSVVVNGATVPTGVTVDQFVKLRFLFKFVLRKLVSELLYLLLVVLHCLHVSFQGASVLFDCIFVLFHVLRGHMRMMQLLLLQLSYSFEQLEYF